MVAPKPSNGYSARVCLELRIGETRIPLAQIANDFIILDQPAVLPGTTGEVVAFIDENQRRWLATWVPSDTLREVVHAQFRDV